MPATEADILFRDALIFDGTGAPPFVGNVAVSGDRISAVGTVDSMRDILPEQEFDVQGLALAPGFIDAHTHDDRIVVDRPEMTPKISQGVTTVVTGNCGISLAPVSFAGDPPAPMNLLGGQEAYQFPSMAAYADRLRTVQPSVNVLALIGHSALRLAAMQNVTQGASDEEIAAMRRCIAQCMEDGASGFSTGLFYPTNAAADENEVAAIGSAVAEHGGVYATHMRDEAVHVIDSIHESSRTALSAGLPLLISHHKCAGIENWGRTRETLPLIKRLALSQPINFDVYPYAAGSTNLREDLVTDEIRIMVTWSRPHPEMRGRDLADIADDWGLTLLDASRRLDPAGAIYFQMHDDDVRRVMESDLSIIGSDGLPHDEHPHPRLWGTFPRVIGKFAREMGLFSIETAIHKMTGKAAAVFGLKDRGHIAAGCAADVVIFDPRTIIDRATYEDPELPSIGIDMVFVNGVLAFHNGRATGSGAGRLLRGRREWAST